MRRSASSQIDLSACLRSRWNRPFEVSLQNRLLSCLRRRKTPPSSCSRSSTRRRRSSCRYCCHSLGSNLPLLRHPRSFRGPTRRRGRHRPSIPPSLDRARSSCSSSSRCCSCCQSRRSWCPLPRGRLPLDGKARSRRLLLLLLLLRLSFHRHRGVAIGGGGGRAGCRGWDVRPGRGGEGSFAFCAGGRASASGVKATDRPVCCASGR